MIKNSSLENRWIGFLFLCYFFGLLGLSLGIFRDFFLQFTPLNLILTLVVFYKVNKQYSKKFILLSVIVFLIGFTVEAIGVNTGVLFGNYAYGKPFGYKVFKTPILIGVNWLFLAFSTYGITQYFTNKAIWLILIPPLLMTALDFVIEPIAMELDFWSWENDTIPLQNFVMWFLTSLVIHTIIYLFNPKINGTISFIIYGFQFVFFGVLNCVF